MTEARIEEHPILGVQEKGEEVTFFFDGKEVKSIPSCEANTKHNVKVVMG